ncbi:MAG: rubredoxin [Magnetococcales bacterium]|nr:rubredoxin [Magnetococcales bacterium]
MRRAGYLIYPGKKWSDLPDYWSCSDCFISKENFTRVEVRGRQ